MITARGHSVLHLPPYHPDLNPIELVWGDLKGQLARESVGTSLREKEAHLRTLFSRYTPDKWKKVCEHVKEVEMKYRRTDHIVENEIEHFIVTVGASSDSESDDEFESNCDSE